MLGLRCLSSASLKCPLRVDAQDAKFHLGLDIEEVDAFGPEPFEQSDGLFGSHGDKHLDGLIGKLKKMRRVHATAAAKTFAARMEAGAAKAQFVDKPEKPFTHLLAFVAAVLVREKSDLITIHVALLTAISALDRTRARLWS